MTTALVVKLFVLGGATRSHQVHVRSIASVCTQSAQTYAASLDELTPAGGVRLNRQLRPLHSGKGSRTTGRLSVGSLPHSLYYEVHGSIDPSAPVALFLHGGPGAGCFARHANFFAPESWCVVLLDQRGCGASSPADRSVGSALSENTLEQLVADCDALRLHLGVVRWSLVFGGSWGTTLALAYAQAHPSSVRALLLRGVCTMRISEVLWMFGALGGAAQLRSEGWKAFAAQPFVTDEERAMADGSGVVRAYARALAGEDSGDAAKAASGWMSWESEVTSIGPAAGQLAEAPSGEYPLIEFEPVRALGTVSEAEYPVHTARFLADFLPSAPAAESPAPALAAPVESPGPSAKATRPLHAQALLTSHFCVQALDAGEPGLRLGLHDGGLLSPLAIRPLREAGVRCVIVQGLRDSVCPPVTAFELQAAWPEAQLQLCLAAGHSMYSPAITSELVRAIEMLRPALSPDERKEEVAGEGSPDCPVP